MKIGKDGKLKLSKDERQIGNFVFKNEPEYIKICDINSQMTHRVSKHLNIGRFLEMGLKQKDDNSLSNYATMLWYFSNVLPDIKFKFAIEKACEDCVNRHKEFYGIKEDITSEQDKEIIDDVKATNEAIEELKEKNTNEDSK